MSNLIGLVLFYKENKMAKILKSKVIIGVITAFLLLISVGLVLAVPTAQQCITYCTEHYGTDVDLLGACLAGCKPDPVIKPPKS